MSNFRQKGWHFSEISIFALGQGSAPLDLDQHEGAGQPATRERIYRYVETHSRWTRTETMSKLLHNKEFIEKRLDLISDTPECYGEFSAYIFMIS